MTQTFAEWLDAFRRERNWSMRAMALRFGISPSTMQDIVTGISLPRPATLKIISERTGVDYDRLLELAGYRTAESKAADPRVDWVIAEAEKLSPERQAAFWRTAATFLREIVTLSRAGEVSEEQGTEALQVDDPVVREPESAVLRRAS